MGTPPGGFCGDEKKPARNTDKGQTVVEEEIKKEKHFKKGMLNGLSKDRIEKYLLTFKVTDDLGENTFS